MTTHGYPTKHYSSPTTTPPTSNWSRALRRYDWVLTLSALAMSGVGAMLVYSATRQRYLDAGLDPQYFLKRHMFNLVAGFALGLIVSRFNYRLLRAYAPFVYGFSLLGIVAVLSPLGVTINGAKAWIALPGGFTLQPSEFAKIAIIVLVAMLLAEKRDAEDRPRGVDVIQAVILAGIPMAVIVVQKDLGTVIVIFTILLGMIAISGASMKWIAGLMLLAVVAVFGAVQLDLVKQYQVDRIAAFVDPSLDPQGVGYNTEQARIAIGSGGLTGTGLFKGPQTNGKFVPEQQTDFVFTVAGEELGFVGSAGLIGLLGIVLWRAGRIAMKAGDMFGRLVATGVICWFGFQAFENIGMNLGIMPVTGVPLPFVSYGGTSMFATWIAIGLLQNVHMKSTD